MDQSCRHPKYGTKRKVKKPNKAFNMRKYNSDVFDRNWRPYQYGPSNKKYIKVIMEIYIQIKLEMASYQMVVLKLRTKLQLKLQIYLY